MFSGALIWFLTQEGDDMKVQRTTYAARRRHACNVLLGYSVFTATVLSGALAIGLVAIDQAEKRQERLKAAAETVAEFRYYDDKYTASVGIIMVACSNVVNDMMNSMSAEEAMQVPRSAIDSVYQRCLTDLGATL